jgi:hypothetical protein
MFTELVMTIPGVSGTSGTGDWAAAEPGHAPSTSSAPDSAPRRRGMRESIWWRGTGTAGQPAAAAATVRLIRCRMAVRP